MKIIDCNAAKIQTWSGGTTQELYIEPVESHFIDRNFEMRLSIATIDQENTSFTSLDGFKRNLLLLSGRITLISESGSETLLEVGSMHAFSGGEVIQCLGTGRDFNLMTSNSLTCKSLSILPKQEEIEVSIQEGEQFFLFSDQGSAEIIHDEIKTLVPQKQLFQFCQPTNLKILCSPESTVIACLLRES